MVLDPRTLGIASLVSSLCLLALLKGVKAVHSIPRGFRSWELSQLLGVLGVGFLALRGVVPIWTSILFGNLLGFAAIWLISDGYVRFYGLKRRIPPWVDALVVLTGEGLLMASLHQPATTRIAIAGVVCAYLLLHLGLDPLASAEGRRNPAQRALSILALAGAALMLFRTAWALRVPPFNELWQEGWTVAIPGLVLTTLNAVAIYVALYFTFERSEQALRTSLAEVKMLSGLLPICAHCHKIRNDKGYWSQLELFIGEHSEAQFTHCICPECFAKQYPGEDDATSIPSPRPR